MPQVLACERCGAIYPITHDGLRCIKRNGMAPAYCAGRLIVVWVDEDPRYTKYPTFVRKGRRK